MRLQRIGRWVILYMSNLTNRMFQLSQFWYTEDTARRLARECIEAFDSLEDGPKYVACVSCPSVMEQLVKQPVRIFI